MNYSYEYIKNVIMPIELIHKQLINKKYSNNNYIYKEQLKQIEELLIEKYKKLEEFI